MLPPNTVPNTRHLSEFITHDKTWERSLSPETKNALCDYMVKMKTEVTWRNKIFCL